ncbi:Arginine exporter protein ArgO [Moraxella lacunata]|uniref:Arginine exporter protein ArgO n=1 Tax=Moraxella lacunata TaxID=477 RepID=A0A378QD75_MORLA|nr:LysE family transporter [Moraxella lacunata]STY98846.1 Arginine exporter protein ArgO [Moraxella lacunata]
MSKIWGSVQLKRHVFWVCLTCFLCDAVLISAGVLGFGTLIGQSKTALLSLAVVGVLFLFWYGLRAFKSAWQGGANLMVSAESDEDGGGKSIKQSVGITLALTLLNPPCLFGYVGACREYCVAFDRRPKTVILAGSGWSVRGVVFWVGLWGKAVDPII